MDDDARARIVKHIDKTGNIRRELKKIFDYEPSEKQVRAIRDYTDIPMRSDKIVMNERNNRLYLREDGKFKRMIKKTENVFYNPRAGSHYRYNPDTGKYTKID